MKKLSLVLAFGMLACPALADGKIYVQLPDLSSLSKPDAESLLRDTTLANIVMLNCGQPYYEEDWSLLTDSADMLAYTNLGLSVSEHEDLYSKPAFELLRESGTCVRYTPMIEKVLARLVAFGGARSPLPDQEQAYLDWRAWQDSITP